MRVMIELGSGCRDVSCSVTFRSLTNFYVAWGGGDHPLWFYSRLPTRQNKKKRKKKKL